MSESKLFGVSFRGIIAFMVVGTVCGMALKALDVKEPLHSIALLIIGAYFGKPASAAVNGNGDKKEEVKNG